MDIKKAVKLYRSGKRVADIAKSMGISTNTLYDRFRAYGGGQLPEKRHTDTTQGQS